MANGNIQINVMRGLNGQNLLKRCFVNLSPVKKTICHEDSLPFAYNSFDIRRLKDKDRASSSDSLCLESFLSKSVYADDARLLTFSLYLQRNLINMLGQYDVPSPANTPSATHSQDSHPPSLLGLGLVTEHGSW
ncbi:hypothetical protein ABKN59_006028 [Abortiporus biennis]